MNFKQRKCPGCCSDNAQENMHSERRAEDLDVESLRPYWNGLFKEKIFFTYFRCKKCKLLFTKEFFSESQLELLYSQMPPNMDMVPDKCHEKTQKGYFEMLKEYDSLKGSFVELGSDIGLFVKYCIDEGNYSHYSLFEPNIEVHGHLSELLKGTSHNIHSNMYNFDCLEDDSVTTLVLIHVFDHLLDPVKTLKDLRPKLKNSAKILIVTHDESSLLRKVLKDKWPPFCLQHPQIYNRQSIKLLLKEAGYSVLSQRKTKNYFPLTFLISNLALALGIKIGNNKNFDGLNLGLRLGNIATIATTLSVSNL